MKQHEVIRQEIYRLLQHGNQLFEAASAIWGNMEIADGAWSRNEEQVQKEDDVDPKQECWEKDSCADR